MNPELLIDDSEFATPLYLPVGVVVQKFQEAQHRRDDRGRFTEQATITVGDRQITVVKPRRAASDKLVPLDVLRFDERFKGDTNFYLDVGGGKNAISDRYARFGKFIAENDSIESPEVYVGADGRVGFTNGRHRYAYLRDQGITSIPVAMDAESVVNAKKHGYLSAVKKAWDESNKTFEPTFVEPEHSYGNTQIAIAPTSSAAATLNAARDRIRDEDCMATGKDVDPNHVTVRYGLVNDDLDGLRSFIARQTPFEARVIGVELFPASEHSDGAVPVVARIASPELRAIEEEIGQHADFKEKSFPVYKPHCTLAYCKPESASKYLDLYVDGSFVVQSITITHSSGVQETIPFGMAQKWNPNQPRDEKGRFADLGLHGGLVTVLHGTTRQNAESILAGGFKAGNPASVAAQIEKEYGLPSDSILTHVAFEFARGRRDLGKVHFTTDESVADQYSVPEVLQDALTAAHMLLHPTPEDVPFTKEMHAARKQWIDREAKKLADPALLAVTVPFETVGQHGFGKQFTLEEFKALLTKFPKAEEDIFNNITIPIEALHGARIERWKKEGSRRSVNFHNRPHWEESKHPRNPSGSSRGGEFMETLHGAKDALDSLLNKEKNVSIQRDDVRRFLELADEQLEDPDLTDLQVEGMTIFGGNGLGIIRDDMPQIPPEHRARFLEYAAQNGIKITEETVDPLTLKPTQTEVSARRVGKKLRQYEKGDRKFPPVLVSSANRILDGHHHWGMMAAFALEFPDATMPIFRLHTSTKKALAAMLAYMKIHNLSRASLSGSTVKLEQVVKWDEVQHPRDKEGQFTEREAFIQAAVRRGEPLTVTENEFLAYHYTGHIPMDAYERYEAGDYEHVHRKDFQTLLETREVNGQTVEIRLQTETPTYHKWRPEAPKAERDRLYEEYEQAAKKLGTTTMMAGIDLGHDSEEYKALDVFAKRWLATGEGWERDAQGNLIPLTPEEAKAQGKPAETYTVGAFVGDKAIGYAGDEFGASGVYLAREYQKHGIGLTLFKTYLEKSGRLAKGRQFGQMTSAGQALTRALYRQLVKEAESKKADPATGRYVTPFVSFDKQGDEQLRMIASLNSSRLATWGFTAEAEVLGMARYRLTAVLDGRTSKFCRMISGKVFVVTDARKKVIEALNVQDPEDLRVVQPWPKQTKAAMAMYAEMSTEEFTARGLHIPPYHPHCRTLCRAIEGSIGEAKEAPVPAIPEETETFQLVTAEDLKELGIDATPENVAAWNENIGMSPVELLSKLTGMPPQDVMTKPLGVGANPIQFDPNGNIGVRARGEIPSGVEFKLGAILDPFTGIFYLSQAELLAGTPKAELSFLRNLFTELINTGLKSSATSVAVGVEGNAIYYAKMGFLPDELDWDALRLYALEGDTVLPEVLASLDPDDALLVQHLLQDKSVGAMSALIELPFTYQGRTVGEWLFGDAAGTWSLDLTDDVLVAQAKAYLS